MDAYSIARFLETELHGQNIQVNGYSSLSNSLPNSVVFVKKLSSNNLDLLSKTRDIMVITEDTNCLLDNLHLCYVLTDNPRLSFIKVVSKFFSKSEIKAGVHPSAVIEPGAIIEDGVSIGPNCYIGENVRVGRGTIILPNVSILGKATIGNNCYLKPGVVIGGPGFGFEYDEKGYPLHFPHTGEVIIGNNVYIGANTSIDRATMDATIIEDNVKIDNLVHVSHNCHIKKNSLIAAGAIFSGGTQIGDGAWIAPNSTTYQKVNIGEKSMVGIGSVVLRSVKPGATVFGNPASKLE